MSAISYLPNTIVRNLNAPMTVFEARLLMSCCSFINRMDRTIDAISIPMVKVVESRGGYTYKLMREAIASLREIHWNGEKLFHDLELVHQVGFIEGNWNPVLRPELLRNEGYTSVVVPSKLFRYAHSYRLLWLLSSYRSLGSVTFSVDQLRVLMTGSTTCYPAFGKFKSDCLNHALQELDEQGYKCNMNEVKRGRKVASLKFTIRFPVYVKPVPEHIKQALAEKRRLEPVATPAGSPTKVLSQDFLLAPTYGLSPEQQKLKDRLCNTNNKMEDEFALAVVKSLGTDINKIEKAHKLIYKIVQLNMPTFEKKANNVGAYLYTALIKEFNLQI